MVREAGTVRGGRDGRRRSGGFAGPQKQAERWFQEAVNAGNVNAMANLGRLKLKAGEPEEADRWRARLEGGAEAV